VDRVHSNFWLLNNKDFSCQVTRLIRLGLWKVRDTRVDQEAIGKLVQG
jgi:hypothetical protein